MASGGRSATHWAAERSRCFKLPCSYTPSFKKTRKFIVAPLLKKLGGIGGVAVLARIAQGQRVITMIRGYASEPDTRRKINRKTRVSTIFRNGGPASPAC